MSFCNEISITPSDILQKNQFGYDKELEEKKIVFYNTMLAIIEEGARKEKTA